MTQLFKNNAYSALFAGIAADALTLTLAPGSGARFPSPTGGDHFLATLSEIVDGLEAAWEVVKVTARTGDTLTIVRAQEGTTARIWASGTQIDLRFTAGSAEALQASIADTNIVKKNVTQTFSAVQKSTPTTDNDLTVDCALFMDGVCTPTAGGALNFSNISAGVKFEILFVNTSNYAFTKGSNTKCPSSLFNTISVTGRYILAGRCLDGVNIDLTCSGAMS